MLYPNNCITFADYIVLVLYHAQKGYYSSAQIDIGSQGDFFTCFEKSHFSPIISSRMNEGKHLKLPGHVELDAVHILTQ